MKLEEVTAVLRPRGSWEAADLGCALVRRHYPKVMALWAMTVLPLWALILFLLRDNLVLAWFLIALLQPLYGRAVLFYISRALFGDTPGLREVMGAVPGLWTRGLFYSMTIGRFSVSRSFLLPVILLERPKWSVFKARAKTLKLHGDGALSLTLTTVVLTIAMMFALLALGRMLVTTGVSPDWRAAMQDFFILVFQAMADGELGGGGDGVGDRGLPRGHHLRRAVLHRCWVRGSISTRAPISKAGMSSTVSNGSLGASSGSGTGDLRSRRRC